MQQEIQNPLALKLLEGEFEEGDTIRIDVAKDGSLEFRSIDKGGKIF
ncbi:MAG: hypothetical protein ABIJ35_00815 [Acidobacteriota bacterium]